MSPRNSPHSQERRHAILGPRVPLMLGAVVAVVAVEACNIPPLNLERMIFQDHFVTWQDCTYFEDDRVMRTLPSGTVPRDQEPLGSASTMGIANGVYLDRVPLRVTRELLETGRARFEVYCATCHGIRGDGISLVALQMDLRKPPPIAGPASRGLPPGRIYQVINDGYGLMRSYKEDLTLSEERWAVVAYLEALGKTYGLPLQDLPPDVRSEAEKELR